MIKFLRNLISSKQTKITQYTKQDLQDYLKNNVLSLEDIFSRNYFGNKNPINNPVSQSPIVFKCVQILSDRIPKVPLKFYNKASDKQIYEGPAVDFILNPGPFTLFEFLSQTIMYWSLYGEYFWYWRDSVGSEMNGGKGKPYALDILNPTNMVENLDIYNTLQSWSYVGPKQLDNQKFNIILDNIIYSHNSNQNNQYRGTKAIDALANYIGVDVKIVQQLISFYDNYAIPGTIITVDKDAMMTKEDLKEYVDEWNRNLQGASKNFKTKGLGPGIDAKVLGVTQDKMQLVESLTWIRNMILSVFNVPLTYAGFTEGINRATAETQERNFWEGAVSILSRIESSFNNKVIPRIDPKVYCKFDIGTIDSLKRDLTDRWDLAIKAISAGWSMDDASEMFELNAPSTPGITDKHRFSFNLVSVEDESNSDKSNNNYISNSTEDYDKNTISKRAILRRHKSFMNKHERIINSNMKNIFNTQRTKVLKIINKYSKKTDTFYKNEFDKTQMYLFINDLQEFFDKESIVIIDKLGPIISNTTKESQEMALKVLGIERDVILNTEIINERINLIKGVNDLTFLDIKKKVFAGVNEGNTIREIGQSIKEVFKNASENRAMLIARTESLNIISAATNNEYKQNGVEKKQWITSKDGNVRDTCLQAESDGAIDISSNFSNGLEYPSEYNCRCAIIPIVS